MERDQSDYSLNQFPPCWPLSRAGVTGSQEPHRHQWLWCDGSARDDATDGKALGGREVKQVLVFSVLEGYKGSPSFIFKPI